MRRLILLRHAKSAWDDPTLDDKSRPLNARGRRDAPRIGAWLAAGAFNPQLVLVSTAVRTRDTWLHVAPALGVKVQERFRDDLYLADAQHILAVASEADPMVTTLMVIGHNPGMEDAATMLVGHGSDAVRKAMAAKFPTSGLAVIDFTIASWRDIATGTGELKQFVTPKALD